MNMYINSVFRAAPEPAKAALAALQEPLRQALPMRQSHFKDLPFAIAELSEMLTSERGELSRPYWSQARYTAAYLWYFLPWNLLRLSCLLPSLPLSNEFLPPDSSILDLGSGPLTLPLALWLARPDLRTTPLRFICSDVQSKPLDLGRKLLEQVMGPDSAWQITLFKGDALKTLRAFRKTQPSLICALNVCNELVQGRNLNFNTALNAFMCECRATLAPNGSLLFIEPGNRLGGKVIATLRDNALGHATGRPDPDEPLPGKGRPSPQEPLVALLPCTHQASCPLLKAQQTWCHFQQSAGQAPQWLQKLSQAARLQKQHISLSFVLLSANSKYRLTCMDSAQTGTQPPVQTQTQQSLAPNAKRAKQAPLASQTKTLAAELRGRVVSGLFKVPELHPACCYACTDSGLALVPGAAKLSFGDVVQLRKSDKPGLDSKSGAVILYPATPLK